MARGLALLLLAASAAAQDALFSPEAAPLRALSAREFETLDRDARLRARSLDPARYRAPPPVRDALPQAHNVRHLLRPGFAYEERLAARQRLAQRGLDRPPAQWLSWLLKLEEPSPERFLELHGRVRYDGNWLPGQAVQALRRSELQFHAWLLDEMARRLDLVDERDRGPQLAALERLLEATDAFRRRLAAQVLGGVRDARAKAALEDRLATERDPDVLDALVSGRVRQGGAGLEPLLTAWTGDARPEVRGAAYRACETLEADWVEPLLRARLERETGRARDDLLGALARRAGEVGGSEGTLSFYGIATYARRVLFCIDVSGSMRFPMDGEGGVREPRIEKTRRELAYTVHALPPGTAFDIALFAGTVEAWQGRLVEADDARMEEAQRFLDRMAIRAGTNVHAVLEYALASGAETVFLLTDGEPNCGTIVDPALILEEFARRNAARRILLHTIGLSQDQNAELLVNLAWRGGGRYVASR